MVTFRKFSDYNQAREIYDILIENRIDAELEDSSERFNPSFASTPFSKEHRVKLEPSGFEHATAVLRLAMKPAIAAVDSDHYLFAFTENELKEILIKPDEWDLFDYFLAETILEGKGVDITSEEIEKEKKARLEAISRPEKRPVFLIIFGYIFSIGSGFFGLLFGWILFNSRKTLYTGETVYSYREADRRHGYIMFFISTVSMVIYTLKFLLII